MKKKLATKMALAFSVCLLIVWGILGAGRTLSWFVDTAPAIKNNFIVPELDLDVFYKNDVVTRYTEVGSDTKVFNDDALYEPGYTQVVYLRVDNAGGIDFTYKISVNASNYVDSINVYGQPLHLPNYLRFGVIFGDSEAELDRELARLYAGEEMAPTLVDQMNNKLNTYSRVDDGVVVKAGQSRYIALIVYMPTEVGNEANYRGTTVPMVELGVTLYAQQLEGAPQLTNDP